MRTIYLKQGLHGNLWESIMNLLTGRDRIKNTKTSLMKKETPIHLSIFSIGSIASQIILHGTADFMFITPGLGIPLNQEPESAGSSYLNKLYRLLSECIAKHCRSYITSIK